MKQNKPRYREDLITHKTVWEKRIKKSQAGVSYTHYVPVKKPVKEKIMDL